jgi:UDP-N-acetylglucosamine diphosphorylase/glucosamine-1-phosphate N-acetyltransferase
MNLILFDDKDRENLLPLTYTKPACELRIGILKIREKWEEYLGTSASFKTVAYLQNKFSFKSTEENLYLKGTLIPDSNILNAIKDLKDGQGLKKGSEILVWKSKSGHFSYDDQDILDKSKEFEHHICIINFPWKVFSHNGQEIFADYELLTKGRKSELLSKTVNVIAQENIFVEEGFKGEFFTLNASSGPIYLGKDSEIMEGAIIRGPFSLGEHSTIKLAAKIYGPTTIGPNCKAGGEINNSILQENSNKGHDGFLGNSVIGEWCNLGADTNNSNLKNNYSEVKIWNYPQNRFIKTGLQFCGLIMGDHSKCGINTMFNTGTVVGISANIFGAGFPRNFIPSFSWGGAHGLEEYKTEKAFETMELVMMRRGLQLGNEDKAILLHIFEETKKYRK